MQIAGASGRHDQVLQQDATSVRLRQILRRGSELGTPMTDPSGILPCVPGDSRVPQETSEHRPTPLVRGCRTAAGLTIEELARRIGVPSSTILDYENGEQVPTLRVLHKIITVTGYRPCATSGSLALATKKRSVDGARPWFPDSLADDHEDSLRRLCL